MCSNLDGMPFCVGVCFLTTRKLQIAIIIMRDRQDRRANQDVRADNACLVGDETIACEVDHRHIPPSYRMSASGRKPTFELTSVLKSLPLV